MPTTPRAAHLAREAVADDADEGARDLHHKGLERLLAGRAHQLAQALGRSLAQLSAAALQGRRKGAAGRGTGEEGRGGARFVWV